MIPPLAALCVMLHAVRYVYAFTRAPGLLALSLALLLLGMPVDSASPARADNALTGTELVLPVRRAVVEQGEALPTAEFDIGYTDGNVMLSGDMSSSDPFWVDDYLVIEVTRPDGTVARWERNFTPDCYKDQAATPEDLTELFQPGLNTVRVTIFDVCGGFVGPLSPIILSGATVTVHQAPRFPWVIPSALVAAPILLIAVWRGLAALRRRRERERLEKDLPALAWPPGERPLGILDGMLIAMSTASLDSDGVPSEPLTFSPGPITIGWGSGCTIRVPRGPGVERKHAGVWLRDQRLVVHNLVQGATTVVSGHPVLWDTLETGDLVEVGPYQFRCVDVSAVQATRVLVAATGAGQT
jgi:hypothetical protein